MRKSIKKWFLSPDAIDRIEKMPQIFIDKDLDFASIKIQGGIEAKSYAKEDILFSENKKGEIIEIQILNLSLFKTRACPHQKSKPKT